MMEIEPYDDECISTLKYKLDAMRERRAQQGQKPIPANGSCNTFKCITSYNYLHILQDELRSNRNVMDLFVILVNSLTNPRRSGNVVYQGLPQPIRPCELWERFAECYLKYIDVPFHPPPDKIDVTHTGKSHDRGVDVLIRWSTQTHDTAVVQVKRGSFFRTGKGTDIVLKLIGSMFIFGAKFGIIFTNESEERDVKADAREIIEIAKQRDLHIYILDEYKMMYYAKQDAKSCKNLMVEFIGRFLA